MPRIDPLSMGWNIFGAPAHLLTWCEFACDQTLHNAYLFLSMSTCQGAGVVTRSCCAFAFALELLVFASTSAFGLVHSFDISMIATVAPLHRAVGVAVCWSSGLAMKGSSRSFAFLCVAFVLRPL
mmetsp:Transcript_27404/g.91079  ORF Transcript_27404/g.91079 Transcript_27404/m.91079 type:complete len:125 (+) Transcript_27404:962-1336(+)